MKRLNKTELMQKVQRKTVDIEVPEWDGIVTIKSLSAGVVLECQKYIQTGDHANFAYSLLANSIVDEDGKLMFTVEEAKEFDYSVLDKLVLEVMDLNKLAPDQVQKAREQLKNSH